MFSTTHLKMRFFFRNILIPFKKSITKEELIIDNWKIIRKINFQRKLFLNSASEISTYKNNLNKILDNSTIYSKINVRHGCVYFHTKREQLFELSSKYPKFSFD